MEINPQLFLFSGQLIFTILFIFVARSINTSSPTFNKNESKFYNHALILTGVIHLILSAVVIFILLPFIYTYFSFFDHDEARRLIDTASLILIFWLALWLAFKLYRRGPFIYLDSNSPSGFTLCLKPTIMMRKLEWWRVSTSDIQVTKKLTHSFYDELDFYLSFNPAGLGKIYQRINYEQKKVGSNVDYLKEEIGVKIQELFLKILEHSQFIEKVTSSYLPEEERKSLLLNLKNNFSRELQKQLGSSIHENVDEEINLRLETYGKNLNWQLTTNEPLTSQSDEGMATLKPSV